MTQGDESDRHLSATQLEALRAVAAERRWFGIGDGNQGRTCRSLERRGLIVRRDPEQIVRGLGYAITSTGLSRLERCR